MDTFDSQTQLFKALTHPVRLAILDILRDGEECVCHIEALLDCRQAYISQQLAVLREAGLVQVRREGWNIFYRVIKPEIYELLDLAAQITGLENPGWTAFDKKIEKIQSCPCPKCNEAAKIAERQSMEEKC